MNNGIGPILKIYMKHYNISGVDFADSLGITSKHLSEIINKNIDISDELILAISLITDLEASYIIKLENDKKMLRELKEKFREEKDIKKYLNSYYFDELVNNGWIIPTNTESVYSSIIDLLKFFRVRNTEILENKKNNILCNDTIIDNKTFLWIAKCDSMARNQIINDFTMSNIDDILGFLKVERNNKVNENNIIKYFNSKGLYLVICDVLEGTKVRGCSKVKRDKPAIYLTNLYKDKYSFYYSLYHELGHIKKHYNKAKSKYIINGESKLEEEANKFALNNMILPNVWEDIIKNKEEENVLINFSKKYSIPMCFIINRLAIEKYISYNSKLYNKYTKE